MTVWLVCGDVCWLVLCVSVGAAICVFGCTPIWWFACVCDVLIGVCPFVWLCVRCVCECVIVCGCVIDYCVSMGVIECLCVVVVVVCVFVCPM